MSVDVDSALDRRRAEVESRLRQNELLRQEKVSAIRGSSGDEQEMVRGYWLHFNTARKQMSIALQSATPRDLDTADAILNEAVEQCRGLQLKLSQAASYLPPFDIRQSFDSIASLLKDINTVRASLLPKPAFGFKSRRSPAVSVFDVSASDIAGVEVVADVAADSAHGACVVKDVAGSSVVMTREDLQRHSGDVVLTRLRDCTVRLQGPTTAIRMFDLVRCTVIAAPVVGGSIFIEACEGCSIVAAAQQIRIHKAQSCDFYICARGPGHAIIEHSSGVRFAGYELRAGGSVGEGDVAAWLKEAKLEMSSNAWAGVEDFNWLKKERSPNWSILPESERRVFDLEA